MALVYKTLGQSALAATTLTSVYTVPAVTSVTVSTVVICNRGATATTFRLSVAIAGAADTPAQYLYYDQAIDAYSTFTATLGVTLATTSILKAYAASANVSVNVFGVEVS